MKIIDNNNIAIISDDFPTVTSWNVEGVDILFPEQDLLIAGKQKKRGGIPICFPNFGKPVNYKGVEIPQHGFLRDTKNSLYQNQSKDNSFITMIGKVGAYGVHYFMNIKMQVHHHFNIPTLTQTMHITSGDSRETMPLCLGFHPYFKVNRKYLNFFRDGKAMNMNLFSDQTCLPAQKIDFQNVFVIQLDEKLSVAITCLGDFETGHQQICIWSDRPNEYICIEPIIHDNTLFGTDQGYFVGNEAKCFHISYACNFW